MHILNDYSRYSFESAFLILIDYLIHLGITRVYQSHASSYINKVYMTNMIISLQKWIPQ